MKTQFQITEDDYARAMQLFNRLTRNQRFIYLSATIVLVLFIMFGSPILRAAGVGGLIGGAIAILGGRFVISPILARRHYRKYKAIQDVFGIELLPDGIRLSSPSAESKLTWDKMFRWRQNESYIIVYLMPRLFHIVPKSIGSKGFDLSELTNQLAKNVGMAT